MIFFNYSALAICSFRNLWLASFEFLALGLIFETTSTFTPSPPIKNIEKPELIKAIISPWRSSRAIWAWPWAAWSRVLCRVLDWVVSGGPFQPKFWCYDSVKFQLNHFSPHSVLARHVHSQRSDWHLRNVVKWMCLNSKSLFTLSCLWSPS